MYSILGKEKYNNNIVHFIADADEDLIRIEDYCAAGSTVKVPEKGNIHSFVKTPAGKWIVEEGTSDFEFPVNDLDIILPAPEEMIAGEKVSKFGENIEVSASGLVTGTLYDTTFDAFSSLPAEKKGHYFVFKLPVQDDVETMSFYKNGEESKKDIAFDPEVAFRITSNDVNFKVVLDNGQSYTFYFMDVVLK